MTEAMIRLAPIPFPETSATTIPSAPPERSEDVVEIARHEARREVAGGDPVAVARELRRRQQPALDLARDGQLFLRELLLLDPDDRFAKPRSHHSERVEKEASDDRDPAADEKRDAQVAGVHLEGHPPGRLQKKRRREDAQDAADEVDRHADEPVRKDLPPADRVADDIVEPVAEDVDHGAHGRAVQHQPSAPEIAPVDRREEHDGDAGERRNGDRAQGCEEMVASVGRGLGLSLHSGLSYVLQGREFRAALFPARSSNGRLRPLRLTRGMLLV